MFYKLFSLSIKSVVFLLGMNNENNIIAHFSMQGIAPIFLWYVLRIEEQFYILSE